jgi:hypothetical protein
MRPAIKAALISALVFPGLGHFSLKRRARGCCFLLPSVLAILFLVRVAASRANAMLAQIEALAQVDALTPDPLAIAQQAFASGGQETMVTLATVVIAVCWVGSIVDAFFIKP